MKFRYPLQKIVDLKGSQKSMAEWEYAAALGLLRQEEERLEQLYGERREAERALEEASLRPTALARLMLLQDYFDSVDGRIRVQLQGVASAEEQVRRRQSQLAVKMTDEKVWLNARDKAREKFTSERLAVEQNELDEMAMVRSGSRA